MYFRVRGCRKGGWWWWFVGVALEKRKREEGVLTAGDLQPLRLEPPNENKKTNQKITTSLSLSFFHYLSLSLRPQREPGAQRPLPWKRKKTGEERKREFEKKPTLGTLLSFLSSFLPCLRSRVDLLDRPRHVPARPARVPGVLGHRQVGHGAGEAGVVVDGDLLGGKGF